MPRLTIGKYITSEDDCIIPTEFTISFDNVGKDQFEGVFSKYRVLYVDYDVNRLSVRLPEENKYISGAATEIEKLLDYAYLLEEGDMEICEHSELTPDELIAGIRRSVPSMRSFPRRSHPPSVKSEAEYSGISVITESLSEDAEGQILAGAETDERFFEEIPPALFEEESVSGELTEDFVPDYAEIPVDLPKGPEEPLSFDELDDVDLSIESEDLDSVVAVDGVSESVSFEESLSFDELDDVDLSIESEDLDSVVAVDGVSESVSFEEPLSFDELDDVDLSIESEDLDSVVAVDGVSESDSFEEPLSFDELDDVDLSIESEDVIPEFEDLSSEESGISLESEDLPDLLFSGELSGVEGFEGELGLEEKELPDLAQIDIPDIGPDTFAEEFEVPETESSGFDVTDEFSDLENLVEESAADTILLETDELVSEGKYEEAINVLDNYVLENSGSADLWLRRGEICILAERNSDALESYEKALELEPDNIKATLSLFHLFKENERYKDAARLLGSHIKKNPDDSHLWFEKGWLSEKSGDYEEALLDYDQAISLDAGCTKAVASKALLLMRAKKTEEALECYDLLINKKPDSAAVHHSRGLVLKVLGRSDDAIESFKEAVRLDPSDMDTLLEMAILLLETGRYKDALDYYKRLLDSGVSGSEILSGQGDAYLALGMDSEAMAAYEGAIDAGGNILGALKGKAEILASLGLDDEAEAAYNDVLGMNPLDTDVLQKLASLYEETGRPEEALASYEKMLIANPSDTTTINGRIRNLVAIGRYSDAIPLYDSLIVADPKRSDLVAGKAFSLARSGRKDEAIVLYVSALQSESENTGYLLELVTLLSDLGRYGETLPYYDRLIRLIPEETDLIMSRALALYALGMYDKAISGFEDVLRIHPNDTNALLNKGTALFRLGERRDAMGCYKRSIDIDPAVDDEWAKRGIFASSFIEWELDRIKRVPESSLRSRQQVHGSDLKVREDKAEVKVPVREMPASGGDSPEYESLAPPDINIPTKGQLEDPDYLYKKGLALARKGYYRAALKCFDRIETLTENCSEAVFSKGIIYAKNGYFTEALECFDQVLDMNPLHENAQKARKMAEMKKGQK